MTTWFSGLFPHQRKPTRPCALAPKPVPDPVAPNAPGKDEEDCFPDPWEPEVNTELHDRWMAQRQRRRRVELEMAVRERGGSWFAADGPVPTRTDREVRRYLRERRRAQCSYRPTN